ncbi:MAG: PAAR domain-containing protein [Chitinophagaceae bacterium]|nr:PAAR domain-containing protein [Chitinophagaceae bacterium]
MGFAARAGDIHVCPMFIGNTPHVGGPINPPGSPTVLIGGMPAACQGDACNCAGGPMDSILKGSSTVKIGGKPAARMGDSTVHGGKIMAGFPTVNIGD